MSESHESTAPSPYDRLLAAARTAMIAAYPEHAKALAAGKLWKIEEGFAMDAMGEKGKSMMVHRLSPERQEQEIGENAAAIFEGLSESMTTFYRKKLAQAKSK
jgi:hypothetical protein